MSPALNIQHTYTVPAESAYRPFVLRNIDLPEWERVTCAAGCRTTTHLEGYTEALRAYESEFTLILLRSGRRNHISDMPRVSKYPNHEGVSLLSSVGVLRRPPSQSQTQNEHIFFRECVIVGPIDPF